MYVKITSMNGFARTWRFCLTCCLSHLNKYQVSFGRFCSLFTFANSEIIASVGTSPPPIECNKEWRCSWHQIVNVLLRLGLIWKEVFGWGRFLGEQRGGCFVFRHWRGGQIIFIPHWHIFDFFLNTEGDELLFMLHCQTCLINVIKGCFFWDQAGGCINCFQILKAGANYFHASLTHYFFSWARFFLNKDTNIGRTLLVFHTNKQEWTELSKKIVRICRNQHSRCNSPVSLCRGWRQRRINTNIYIVAVFQLHSLCLLMPQSHCHVQMT